MTPLRKGMTTVLKKAKKLLKGAAEKAGETRLGKQVKKIPAPIRKGWMAGALVPVPGSAEVGALIGSGVWAKGAVEKAVQKRTGRPYRLFETPARAVLEFMGVYDGKDPGKGAVLSPKLDGVYAKATRDGIFSKSGKPLDLPHVQKRLRRHFRKNPDGELEGEVWRKGMPIEAIAGAVKSGGDAAKKLRLHVFPKEGQSRPWPIGAVRRVKGKKVATDAEVQAQFQKAVKRGREGVVVQRPDGTKVKLKPRSDEEYEVVDVPASKRGVVVVKDGKRTFKVQGRPGVAAKTGDRVQVSYSGKTRKGVPKAAVAERVRNDTDFEVKTQDFKTQDAREETMKTNDLNYASPARLLLGDDFPDDPNRVNPCARLMELGRGESVEDEIARDRAALKRIGVGAAVAGGTVAAVVHRGRKKIPSPAPAVVPAAAGKKVKAPAPSYWGKKKRVKVRLSAEGGLPIDDCRLPIFDLEEKRDGLSKARDVAIIGATGAVGGGALVTAHQARKLGKKAGDAMGYASSAVARTAKQVREDVTPQAVAREGVNIIKRKAKKTAGEYFPTFIKAGRGIKRVLTKNFSVPDGGDLAKAAAKALREKKKRIQAAGLGLLSKPGKIPRNSPRGAVPYLVDVGPKNARQFSTPAQRMGIDFSAMGQGLKKAVAAIADDAPYVVVNNKTKKVLWKGTYAKRDIGRKVRDRADTKHGGYAHTARLANEGEFSTPAQRMGVIDFATATVDRSKVKDSGGKWADHYQVATGMKEGFHSDGSKAKVGMADPAVLKSLYRKANTANKWGTRGAGFAKDATDVVRGKPRERDASGRKKKREWEKSWAKDAAKKALLVGGGIGYGLLYKKSPRVRAIQGAVLDKAKRTGDDLKDAIANFEERRKTQDFKTQEKSLCFESPAQRMGIDFAFGKAQRKAADLIRNSIESDIAVAKRWNQAKDGSFQAHLKPKWEKLRATEEAAQKAKKRDTAIAIGAGAATAGAAGALALRKKKAEKEFASPAQRLGITFLAKKEEKDYGAAKVGAVGAAVGAANGAAIGGVSSAYSKEADDYLGMLERRKARSAGGGGGVMVRRQASPAPFKEKGKFGKAERLARADHETGARLKKAVKRRTLKGSAAGAAVLGGLSYAAAKVARDEPLERRKTSRRKTQEKRFCTPASELLIELDAVAEDAGWDVRDPRGRSARVFAPGSRKRVRREKKWHEEVENERKLWKAGVTGAGLAAGAAGLAIGRRMPKPKGAGKISAIVKALKK